MNESCAILRYLGSKYGYTPIDPLNAWMSDVIIDMCSSLYCKLNHSFTSGKDDEAHNKLYVESIKNLIDRCAAQLTKHGKKYIAGQKMSTGDFALLAFLSKNVYNNNFLGGAKYTGPCQDAVSANPVFLKYC